MNAPDLCLYFRSRFRRCQAEWRDGALVVKVEIIDRLVPRMIVHERGGQMGLPERRAAGIKRNGRSKAEVVPFGLG